MTARVCSLPAEAYLHTSSVPLQNAPMSSSLTASAARRGHDTPRWCVIFRIITKFVMAGENDGILYCSVLKGDRVLAQSSSVKGNFLEFSRRVLEQSDNSPHRDKATYASGK